MYYIYMSILILSLTCETSRYISSCLLLICESANAKNYTNKKNWKLMILYFIKSYKVLKATVSVFISLRYTYL